MTSTGTPLIEIRRITKHYQAPDPLKIATFNAASRDRIVIAGLDAGGAEALVLLITGALLPEEGDIVVAGRNTRDIATDTDWLTSLDRFGLVTARAVLIDKLAIASNLALPLTVSIDPVPADIRVRVEQVAAETGLPAARLDAPAGTLTPAERVRVHLARALANNPEVVLLEHPTSGLTPQDAQAFGETLRRIGEAREIGWIALSNDDAFSRASAGARMTWRPAAGDIVRPRFWSRWF